MDNHMHFEELDSTNLYAKTHCAELAHGTVISAARQTAGRGRFDRQWVSPAGNLYFTVVLKPQKIDFIANVTQLMSLSVCRALEELKIPAQIKWPNDVLVNGKKICGILSESVTSGSRFEGLVTGVGVNLRPVPQEQISQPACAVGDFTAAPAPDDFLRVLLNYFWQDYPAVTQEGFSVIREAYKKRFALLGKQISVKNGQKPLFGTAQDVSPQGTLLLRTASGTEEIYIGDISL